MKTRLVRAIAAGLIAGGLLVAGMAPYGPPGVRNGAVTLITDGCLECGSCRVICTEHTNVAWEYPRGGHGILFKFG